MSLNPSPEQVTAVTNFLMTRNTELLEDHCAVCDQKPRYIMRLGKVSHIPCDCNGGTSHKREVTWQEVACYLTGLDPAEASAKVQSAVDCGKVWVGTVMPDIPFDKEALGKTTAFINAQQVGAKVPVHGTVGKLGVPEHLTEEQLVALQDYAIKNPQLLKLVTETPSAIDPTMTYISAEHPIAQAGNQAIEIGPISDPDTLKAIQRVIAMPENTPSHVSLDPNKGLPDWVVEQGDRQIQPIGNWVAPPGINRMEGTRTGRVGAASLHTSNMPKTKRNPVFETKMSVLDHGFVVLRNIAGPTRRPDAEFDADDVDPPNAARMSFDSMDSGRTEEADHKLARYLMANWHTSPFEMIEVWLEMKLPIFVARQFVRHRTTSLNEVSGRYVQLPAEWYVPEYKFVQLAADNKKQGGRPIDLNNPDDVKRAERYCQRLSDDCRRSYEAYQESIADGIAMEQSRLHLHVNHYTRWLWKQNFHNLLHFMSLRDHSHAQGESAQYARVCDKLVRQVLPHSMTLYDEYRKRS